MQANGEISAKANYKNVMQACYSISQGLVSFSTDLLIMDRDGAMSKSLSSENENDI